MIAGKQIWVQCLPVSRSGIPHVLADFVWKADGLVPIIPGKLMPSAAMLVP